MSDLLRCDACNGRKTILGMGGMTKTCYKCNGIGWIESATPEIKDNVVNANGNPIKLKKKPGRKPKSMTDTLQIGA